MDGRTEGTYLLPGESLGAQGGAHSAQGAAGQVLGLAQLGTMGLVRGGTPAQDVLLGQRDRQLPVCPRLLPRPHPLQAPGLTSSRVWGARVPGRPCRRLSTARFTFSAQRGSARRGHRRATRPACRTKRSGWRPRAALGTGGRESGGAPQRLQDTSSLWGPHIPAPSAIGQLHRKPPRVPPHLSKQPCFPLELGSPATSESNTRGGQLLTQSCPLPY